MHKGQTKVLSWEIMVTYISGIVFLVINAWSVWTMIKLKWGENYYCCWWRLCQIKVLLEFLTFQVCLGSIWEFKGKEKLFKLNLLGKLQKLIILNNLSVKWHGLTFKLWKTVSTGNLVLFLNVRLRTLTCWQVCQVTCMIHRRKWKLEW